MTALEHALADGDAVRALELAEGLPAEARLSAQLDAWIIAGSVRGVKELLPRLDAQLAARAQAFLADPGPHDEPPAGLDYDALARLRDEYAKFGRARALARVHLAMAETCARPDWAWVHVDHAEALARALGDPRLEALVAAHEARRDAEFGEDDEALERVTTAVALAEAAGEERAKAMAEAARLVVLARRSEAT